MYESQMIQYEDKENDEKEDEFDAEIFQEEGLSLNFWMK